MHLDLRAVRLCALIKRNFCQVTKKASDKLVEVFNISVAYFGGYNSRCIP